MADLYLIAIAGAVAVLSWFAVALTRRALLRYRLLDHPNPRSSHTRATPRGGGLGVLAVLLPAWLAVSLVAPPQGAAAEVARWLVPGAALALAVVSFVDDLRDLPQLIRLLAQALAVFAAVWFLPGPVFQGLLGPVADGVAAALVWLWFVNLFNFMDGIDGIAGVESIGIGGGVYLLGVAFLPADAAYGQALAVAAAAAAFLYWNWSPARIFLGDVGSVPLGFLLGWLLLDLAASGPWHAALILPLYYLADASSTLLRRLVRGAPVWRAHREHCYQIAVQRGRRHATVAGAVALTNAALIGLAVIAALPTAPPAMPWLALAAAAGVVLLLMAWMAYGGRNPAAADA